MPKNTAPVSEKTPKAPTAYEHGLEYAREFFACDINADTGEVMWRKNSTSSRYIADNAVSSEVRTLSHKRPLTPQDTSAVLDRMVADAYRSNKTVSLLDKRVFRHGDQAFYNLKTSDDTTDIVSLSSEGVNFDSQLPEGFRFAEDPHQLPVEVDRSAGVEDIFRLWNLVNIPEEDYGVILSWLIFPLVMPKNPAPVLMFQGGYGSGKTTSAATLKNLFDPSVATLSSMPSGEKDAPEVYSKKVVTVLDNVSKIGDKASDVLCRVVTGGSVERKTLYTTAERTVIDISSAVIMTTLGISEMKADLQSRIALVSIPGIDYATGLRSTMQLEKMFADNAPKIRGGLLQLAAQTMARMQITDYQPRMRLADYDIVAQAMYDVLEKDYGVAMTHSVRDRLNQQREQLVESTITPAAELIMDTAFECENLRPGVVASRLREHAELMGYPVADLPTNGRNLAQALNGCIDALKETHEVIVKRAGHTTWTLRAKKDVADKINEDRRKDSSQRLIKKLAEKSNRIESENAAKKALEDAPVSSSPQDVSEDAPEAHRGVENAQEGECPSEGAHTPEKASGVDFGKVIKPSDEDDKPKKKQPKRAKWVENEGKDLPLCDIRKPQFNHVTYEGEEGSFDRMTVAVKGTDADRDELINDPHVGVRNKVAEFGNDHHRDLLVNDPDEFVRIMVATMGNDHHRDLLIDDPSPGVRATVAMKGNEQQQKVLLKDHIMVVRLAVAEHAAPEIAKLLADDESSAVRYAVTSRGL